MNKIATEKAFVYMCIKHAEDGKREEIACIKILDPLSPKN